jgi:hypothetical protein
MQSTNTDSQSSNVNPSKKNTYEAPAIIYQGIITTRAGSNIGAGSGEGIVDPADLFGND